jgi:hypothetical protein
MTALDSIEAAGGGGGKDSWREGSAFVPTRHARERASRIHFVPQLIAILGCWSSL